MNFMKADKKGLQIRDRSHIMSAVKGGKGWKNAENR